MGDDIRVICFIDGSNLFGHLSRAYGSGKVRFANLCRILAGPARRLTQWRYYAAPIPQGQTPEEHRKYAGQQRFFTAVQRHRKGVLRLARFERDHVSGALREKGVDVLLAIDLVRLAAENTYDVAIVLSGDGDLVPAVQMAQQIYGKQVEVAMPDIPAFHIKQIADAFIEITPTMYSQVQLD
jgi:uncharacterized LabA/DUF88 family protein